MHFRYFPSIPPFMLPIVSYLRGTLRKREFNLTDKYIEFYVPPVPLFNVLWSDFDEIFITKRKEVTIVANENLWYLDIALRRKSQEKIFCLDTTRGFHHNVGNQILASIEERAIKKESVLFFLKKGFWAD